MYRMERTEIVCNFSNSALLVFVGLYISFEAIENLFEPPEDVDFSYVTLIGLIGLIVHIIAAVLFREQLHMRSENAIQRRQIGVEGILMDALLNAAPSIGVIISTSVIHMSAWTWTDAFVSLLIAFSLFYNAFPVCVATGRVLLQSVPLSIKNILEKSLRDAMTVDGVLEIKQNKVHFWTYSPGVFVGTLVVRVKADADEQQVLKQLNNIFAPIIHHLTIQVEKDDWQDNSQSGESTTHYHHHDHHDHHEHHNHHHDHHHDHHHEYHHEYYNEYDDMNVNQQVYGHTNVTSII